MVAWGVGESFSGFAERVGDYVVDLYGAYGGRDCSI